jgi:hypothetical protein
VSPEEKDLAKLKKRFPSAHARVAADKAVDHLPPNAPMSTYTDLWIASYRKAGGKETKYKD